MNPAQTVISRVAPLGACFLLISCAHRPTFEKVTDVVITSRVDYKYDDPEFLPCRTFNPSVRDVTRFLTTAIIMEPGETDDGDPGEPCSVSGDARIRGAEASWRMNMFGVGSVTFEIYDDDRYRPLAMGGARGVKRARSRLLALFGPDYFTPAPREKVSLDTALRNRAFSAGLPEVQEGEVRVWWSSINLNRGVSTFGGELIEHQFAYRIDPSNEMHGRSVWVRSRLSPEMAEAVRQASADVVGLNGMKLDCALALDGVRVQIEAMMNGVRVILEAQDPDESTGDACRRVWTLEQLLWNAINKR
jgi:hypothetical protein